MDMISSMLGTVERTKRAFENSFLNPITKQELNLLQTETMHIQALDMVQSHEFFTDFHPKCVEN